MTGVNVEVLTVALLGVLKIVVLVAAIVVSLVLFRRNSRKSLLAAIGFGSLLLSGLSGLLFPSPSPSTLAVMTAVQTVLTVAGWALLVIALFFVKSADQPNQQAQSSPPPGPYGRVGQQVPADRPGPDAPLPPPSGDRASGSAAVPAAGARPYDDESPHHGYGNPPPGRHSAGLGHTDPATRHQQHAPQQQPSPPQHQPPPVPSVWPPAGGQEGGVPSTAPTTRVPARPPGHAGGDQPPEAPPYGQPPGPPPTS